MIFIRLKLPYLQQIVQITAFKSYTHLIISTLLQSIIIQIQKSKEKYYQKSTRLLKNGLFSIDFSKLVIRLSLFGEDAVLLVNEVLMAFATILFF